MILACSKYFPEEKRIELQKEDDNEEYTWETVFLPGEYLSDMFSISSSY